MSLALRSQIHSYTLRMSWNMTFPGLYLKYTVHWLATQSSTGFFLHGPLQIVQSWLTPTYFHIRGLIWRQPVFHRMFFRCAFNWWNDLYSMNLIPGSQISGNTLRKNPTVTYLQLIFHITLRSISVFNMELFTRAFIWWKNKCIRTKWTKTTHCEIVSNRPYPAYFSYAWSNLETWRPLSLFHRIYST